MKFFNRHISPKIILNILLGIAIFGMITILFTVNRMNKLLNAELGFNKDTIITIRTQDSKIILPDTLVFSSEIPGFSIDNEIEVFTDNKKGSLKLAHQFISKNYFDIFSLTKLSENLELVFDNENEQLIYLNKSAVKELALGDPNDVIGKRLLTSNDHELVICGVVDDVSNLCLRPNKQAKIYQLSNEHLAFAFYDKSLLNSIQREELSSNEFISFQTRIQNRYKLIEDVIYSAFFTVNIIIFLIGIGFIGYKYTSKKEKELFKILGIGIHILTMVISKTYLYIIAIMGLVVSPLALILQKFWLEIYAYRINFGLIDLFIILTMSLLTTYLVCCPKKKLEKQLKGKSIHVN